MSTLRDVEEFERIAEEIGLGAVVRRYRQSLRVELAITIWWLFLGLIGLIFGDAVGRAFGGVVFALGLIVAAVTWSKSRRYLYLCTDGLMTTSGELVTNVVTWDEVASIRVWVTRFYTMEGIEQMQRCILHLADGRKLNLARPPYAHAENLATAIEERVTEVTYPRRIAELAETGVTSFGPITVTQEGVRDGARFARWHEITEMKRGRVRLRIRAGGTTVVSRQVRTIHDVTVLETIVSQAVAAHRLPAAESVSPAPRE